MSNLEQILPLDNTKRDRAWKNAREALRGEEVDIEMLRMNIPSKYPQWIILTVVIMSIIVLIAAFIPSAHRLYNAGSNTFCEALIDEDAELQPVVCGVVGVATVALAEAGQIVFFLCLAVLGTTVATVVKVTLEDGTTEEREVERPSLTNYIFWAGVGLSTSVALVGNAHIAQPWTHGTYVFAYLEMAVPPLLVMGIGYALKDLLLHYIERQEALNIEVAKLEMERKNRYLNPESYGNEWNRELSRALRVELRKAGRSKAYKEAIAKLTAEQWRYLIRREIQEMNWVVDVTQETQIEQKQKQVEEVVEQLQAEGQTVTIEEAEQIIEKREEGESWANPDTSEIEVWMNPNGTYSAKSSVTAYVVGEDFPDYETALKRMKRYNYNYKRNQALKRDRNDS